MGGRPSRVASEVGKASKPLELIPADGVDPGSSFINVTSMAQINDHHQKLLMPDLVQDPIASQSIGPQAAQIAMEGFALNGILGNSLKRVKKSLIESAIRPEDLFQVFPGLAADLDSIHLLCGAEGP